MNLTICSLSLFYAYSFSSFLSGNNCFVRNSIFNHYTFSTIFLNINELTIEKTKFKQGIGSILISKRLYMLQENQNLIAGETFDKDNVQKFQQDLKRDGKLVIVRDCFFNQIGDIYNNLFDITDNSKTFLITRCTFYSYCNSKPIFQISTRATTISHICVSDLSTTDNSANNVASFCQVDTPEGSFLKLLYSTIYGTNTKLKQDQIFIFSGKSAMQFQCNNISNFKSADGTETCVSMSFARYQCLTIQMNTITNLNSKYILMFTLGKLESHDACFIGYCNFVNNYYSTAYIRIHNDQNSKMNFRKCYFSCTNNVDKFIDKESSSWDISIQECTFDIDYSDLKDYSTSIISISKVQQINKLPHYTVKNICDGINNIKGDGCGENKCLVENMGCNPSNFGFKENDVPYTLPEIEEETQEFIPTEPKLPSNSKYFSNSRDFTNSLMFSFSGAFSESKGFTLTGKFTVSSLFPDSKKFSESNDFTQSKKFDKTSFFSDSCDFTKSSKFSDTDDFTSSYFFSKSKHFSESEQWDKTHQFTPSKTFTPSGAFSTSFFFSKSEYFTETDDFSKSSYFSNSAKFIKTNEFTKSSYFSNSKKFAKTNEFTKSSYFSSSKEFVKSDEFTRSNDFSKSEIFIISNTLPTANIVHRSVIININQNEANQSSNTMKLGIGVGCGAAALAAALAVGLFLLRKRKMMPIEDIDEEEIIFTDNDGDSIITQNPLNAIMNDDDPFENEFE